MKPLSLNKGPNHQANALVTNNKWLIIIIFFPNIPSFFLSFSHLSTFTFWVYRVILTLDHNDTHTHTIGKTTLDKELALHTFPAL